MRNATLRALVPALMSSSVWVGCAAPMSAQRDLDRCTEQNRKMSAELQAARDQVAALERRIGDGGTENELADRRLRAYAEIAEMLRKAFDPGELSIVLRNGRLVVQLPNDILFDSGRTALRRDGRDALDKIAAVLKAVPQRSFLIAGHTDNDPVRKGSAKFDTNWELSTLRGLAVVLYLQSRGVDPKQLAAAGYGEHMPELANDSSGGKARNRRTEIIIMPTVDEVPKLPIASFNGPRDAAAAWTP